MEVGWRRATSSVLDARFRDAPLVQIKHGERIVGAQISRVIRNHLSQNLLRCGNIARGRVGFGCNQAQRTRIRLAGHGGVDAHPRIANFGGRDVERQQARQDVWRVRLQLKSPSKCTLCCVVVAAGEEPVTVGDLYFCRTRKTCEEVRIVSSAR